VFWLHLTSDRLQAIFKATGKVLETDAELYRSVQARSNELLGLASDV